MNNIERNNECIKSELKCAALHGAFTMQRIWIGFNRGSLSRGLQPK